MNMHEEVTTETNFQVELEAINEFHYKLNEEYINLLNVLHTELLKLKNS